MRFGGIIFKEWRTPQEWADAAREAGYSAVYFPVDYTAADKVIDGYLDAAREADLIICEIGVWNNVLDPHRERREAAIDRAIHQLELAEHVGANCCVNIAGTYHPTLWDGPHKDNFTQRAFDDVVGATQRILDAVKPLHTCYTLEPMPWMLPSTPEQYLSLIQAVDRPGFAAHMDVVNIITSPDLYYRNGEVIEDWFDKLAPYIRSCHAKDIILRDQLTVHLDECRPGTGGLDYRAYLRCVSRLDDRVCLMLEHMTQEEDYVLATRYLKGLVAEMSIPL